MTPEEITRIEAAAASLPAVAESFSRFFYDTLFEIAPELRPLFPDDLGEQEAKLFDELQALITLGLDLSDGGTSFTSRAHDLGHRHVDYGTQPVHYELLGQALLVALAEFVPDWGPTDRAAWIRLYGLVAQTMLEGSRT